MVATVTISVVDNKGNAVDRASVTAIWSYAGLFSGTTNRITNESGIAIFTTAGFVWGTVTFDIRASKGPWSDSVSISIPAGFVGLHEHTLTLGFNPIGTLIEKIMGPFGKIFGRYSWAVPALIITIILVIGLVVFSFLKRPDKIVKEGAAVVRQVGREID